MEKVLGYLFIILLCVFSPNNVFTQKLEEPVIIHPIIGEKLDRAEEEYFKLFPTIENFQEAVFYMNPDSTSQAFISYTLNGTLRDTIIENYVSANRLRKYIDQKLAAEINAEQIVDRGRYITILHSGENIKTGELLAVRDSSFLLLNMEESVYFDNTNYTFDVSHIQLAKTNKLTTMDKTNIAKYIYPIGTGLIAGFIASSSLSKKKTSFDKLGEDLLKNALVGGLIVGLGCLIGYALASVVPIWSESETEYVAPFSEDDIEGLRYSARYQWGEPYYLQKVE